MCTDRRDFLRASAGLAGAALVGNRFAFADTERVVDVQQRQQVPDLIQRLRKMTAGIVPISDDERKGRIAKAQRLMAEQKIDAIYLEPGSSMFYFTGMRWGTSERMFAVVIPQRGELAWVCPKFEEERARELIKFGNDIRTWKKTRVRIVASPKSFATGAFDQAASESKSACASSFSTGSGKRRRGSNL
jgi:Xaa-Pro dipeptidase